MKQTFVMIVLTVVGTAGTLIWGPFIAVAVYYLFAVLRPQWIWKWALPADVSWSEYVAYAAIAGALLTHLGLAGSTDGRQLRKTSSAHAAVLLFGTWTCFTYVTAQNQSVAWPWLLEYLKIFTMFFAASVVVTRADQVRALYLIAACALIYIAYELNFLYLVNRRLDIYHVGYGGLDNNGAGLMLAMGVPLALFAWEATAQWWRWIFAAGIPVLLHAVLMSYSRGAMLALLLVTPLIVMRCRKRAQFALAALAIGCLVPVLAGQEIRQRFFTVGQYEEDASAQSRFLSWEAAIRIANDHPIFGVGIRNADHVSYAYGADQKGRTIHSQYLQLLADTGYVGLALYLLLLGSIVLAIHRARRLLATRIDQDAASLISLLSGIEGALGVFCAGAVFLSLEVFELPYVLMLLGCQVWVISRAAQPAAAPISATADRRVRRVLSPVRQPGAIHP